VHGFLVDLRQSARGLLREPGFSAVAVLALAVGVGSSTAMFSVVDTVLLRPLPYRAPERLIQLLSVEGTGQRVPMGAVEFFELERRSATAEAIGAFYPHAATVALPSGARRAGVANVSASLFGTLGIVPVRGRAFEPREDFAGGQPVAIVSDGFWRRELGGDPGVLGRTLEVDHRVVVIVGVLPRGVVFPRLERYEVFFPLGITAEQAAMPGARSGLYGVARLKRGVTVAAATAEMDSIVHATSGYGVTSEPLLKTVTGEAAPALKAAFAAVLLLLVIACANVALLLLMRGTARARDLAIRAALGGGHGRVALQQVTEGILLAAAGGALGLVLAAFAVDAVAAFAPAARLPRFNELHLDWRMATFALLASLVSGALAGAASAWQALRADLFVLLKEGGTGATPSAARSRVREGLVVAQLALALLLATGAGLLLRSLERLSAVPLGLEPTGRLASFVYWQGPFSARATEQLLAAARSIPGIENAALVGYLPLDPYRNWGDSVGVEGRSTSPTAPDVASINWFTPGYLTTTGIRLVRGRELGPDDDTRTAAAAMVNETFAARFLPGREPIGALFHLYDWPETAFAVVGVVQDVRQWGPAERALPEVYLPRLQFVRNEAANDGAMLVVKSRLPQGRLEAALAAAAAPLRSQLLLGAPKPIDDYLDSHFRQRHFQLGLAFAFAAAALGLAALGVYGAMAFSVVQRRRELAVRAALGAQRRQLSALVLARGARVAGLGICFGLLGTLALSRFLAALLYGVGERDPLTVAVATVTLGTVALVASVLPAIAAARLDPMTVLRSQ